MANKKKNDELEPPPALQAQTKDGRIHLVDIGNLRVFLIRSGKSWFAQGLEIDYFSQGRSIEDAKANFEEGLARTVRLYLRSSGTIAGLLQPAATEVWERFYKLAPELQSLSQTSLHLIPQEALELLAPEASEQKQPPEDEERELQALATPWFEEIKYYAQKAA